MLWTAIKSYFACAWSAATYLVNGMPADKASYWRNCLGFGDSTPDLVASWRAYRDEPSFHHLKDILVEWTDAWPQRAAKVMALGGCIFALVSLGLGAIIGWGVAWVS